MLRIIPNSSKRHIGATDGFNDSKDALSFLCERSGRIGPASLGYSSSASMAPLEVRGVARSAPHGLSGPLSPPPPWRWWLSLAGLNFECFHRRWVPAWGGALLQRWEGLVQLPHVVPDLRPNQGGDKVRDLPRRLFDPRHGAVGSPQEGAVSQAGALAASGPGALKAPLLQLGAFKAPEQALDVHNQHAAKASGRGFPEAGELLHRTAKVLPPPCGSACGPPSVPLPRPRSPALWPFPASSAGAATERPPWHPEPWGAMGTVFSSVPRMSGGVLLRRVQQLQKRGAGLTSSAKTDQPSSSLCTRLARYFCMEAFALALASATVASA